VSTTGGYYQDRGVSQGRVKKKGGRRDKGGKGDWLRQKTKEKGPSPLGGGFKSPKKMRVVGAEQSFSEERRHQRGYITAGKLQIKIEAAKMPRGKKNDANAVPWKK